MLDVILRVRPGYKHGAGDRYHEGDTFAVAEAEAVLLLAAFGDKLERMSGPDSPIVAISTEMAMPFPALPEKPARRRKTEGE